MTFSAVLFAIILGDVVFDPGPPLEPTESLAAIRVPADVVVELVAAEPLVVDPVAMAFDERGRLFVCEFRDYPTGPANSDDPPLSRIKCLEDRDRDGRMDHATVFADQLRCCQGLVAWDGGLIATMEHSIEYLRDTDGDGVADDRRVLFTGLGKINTQLQPACPRLGPDAWIYVTNGLSGGKVHRPGESDPTLDIAHSDLRFHPRRLTMEPVTGLGQFGNTFDNWGNRFTASNRNPAMHEILPWQVWQADPRSTKPIGYHDVIPSGADSRVYPAVATNTTAAAHAGTHSAACGVEVYRGDWLGPDYTGNLFVCDPTAHLVTRSRMFEDGATFRTERVPREGPPLNDWLVSTDRWFRPVALANGPDGALYVADVYRGVIEHPQYIPKGTKLAVDLRAGDDRGRIYRIRPRDVSPRPYKAPESNDDLVAMLQDANGWRRDVAFRLLVERKVVEGVPKIIEIAKHAKTPQARVAALSVLDAMDESSLLPEVRDPTTVQPILNDSDPHVRARMLRMLDRWRVGNDHFHNPVIQLCGDVNPHVRLWAAICLRWLDGERADQARADILARDGQDPWIVSATFASASDDPVNVLRALVADKAFNAEPAEWKIQLLGDLVQRFKTDAIVQNADTIFDLVSGNVNEPIQWHQLAILAGLSDRISTLQQALATTEKQGARASSAVLEARLQQAGEIVNDPTDPTDIRRVALRAFAHSKSSALPVALKLIGSDAPADLQEESTSIALRYDTKSDLLPLIDRWNSLSGPIQSRLLTAWAVVPDCAEKLLDAVEAGKIAASSIDLSLRSRMTDAKAPFAKRAQAIFGSVNADRQRVVDEYASAATRRGDLARGRAVFLRTCASCHRYGLDGHAVGPDLSDVRSKTPEQILLDVLDPNRIVEPRYRATTLLLDDGRVVSGLVVQESAGQITLRQSGGIETSVESGQIEERKSDEKSLMPEGVEKDISVDDMVDLIEFLRSGA